MLWTLNLSLCYASGYSYAFFKKQDEVVCENAWPGTATTGKTKTALLMRSDGSGVLFGDVALNTYKSLTSEQQQKHAYFENFKMTLYVQASWLLACTHSQTLRAIGITRQSPQSQ